MKALAIALDVLAAALLFVLPIALVVWVLK